MLVFYGDDSGSSVTGGVCLVAGYLAVGRDWLYDLEIPWNRELARAPAIKYFKAFQSKRLKGEFKGWSDEDAEAKRNALVEVIATQGGRIVEFSSSIRWEDFESSVTGGLRSVYTHPYYFCIHGIVSLIAKEYLTAVPYPTQRIAYVFDEQNQHELEMEKQYLDVRNTVHPDVAATMGSISFLDDKDCAPLQIADLLANYMRHDLVAPSDEEQALLPTADRENHQRAASILRKLRSSMRPAKRAQWNPDRLKNLCAKIEAGLKHRTFWE